jgi:hypothetical protein
VRLNIVVVLFAKKSHGCDPGMSTSGHGNASTSTRELSRKKRMKRTTIVMLVD